MGRATSEATGARRSLPRATSRSRTTISTAATVGRCAGERSSQATCVTPNLAEAHVRALDYLARGGATTALDLASGVGASVREVIAAVAEVAGAPEVVEQGRRPHDSGSGGWVQMVVFSERQCSNVRRLRRPLCPLGANRTAQPARTECGERRGRSPHSPRIPVHHARVPRQPKPGRRRVRERTVRRICLDDEA